MCFFYPTHWHLPTCLNGKLIFYWLWTRIYNVSIEFVWTTEPVWILALSHQSTRFSKKFVFVPTDFLGRIANISVMVCCWGVWVKTHWTSMTIATKVVNEVAAEKAAGVAEERVADEAERETDEGVGGEIEKKNFKKNRQILIICSRISSTVTFFI